MILCLTLKPKIEIDQHFLAKRIRLMEDKAIPTVQVQDMLRDAVGLLRSEFASNPRGVLALLRGG